MTKDRSSRYWVTWQGEGTGEWPAAGAAGARGLRSPTAGLAGAGSHPR